MRKIGLTDGHLAWGDDIPTESEKVYYRQIANLEKENAGLLQAINNAKAEIKSLMHEPAYYMPNYDAYKRCIEIIDKHIKEKEN